MSKFIYLDNAATTQVYPEVLKAMEPYFTEYYGNPSSIYSFAGESKKAVDAARQTIADFLHATPEEIYFTGGGSECAGPGRGHRSTSPRERRSPRRPRRLPSPQRRPDPG